MVDRSCVLIMAAPSDPLSLKLQRHNGNSNGTANSIPNANPWGTWEELLLGSAVLKHGADNWLLVSQELQSRARAGFSFTPEACRAGYHAIQLRFGAGASREGGSLQCYEELRRLRVAHLKRELEQYDSSIGSLESKIKRLQSEGQEITKVQSSHAEHVGSESNDSPDKPALKTAAHTADSKEICANLAMLVGLDEADGSSSRVETTSNAPNVILHRTVGPIPDACPQAARVLKTQSHASNNYDDGSNGSLMQHHDAIKTQTCTEHIHDGQPLSSNSTLCLSLSKSDTSSREQEKLSQDPFLSFNNPKDRGYIKGTTFELGLSERRPNALDKNGLAHENPLCLSITDKKGEDREEMSHTRHRLPALQINGFAQVAEGSKVNTTSNLGVSPSLKSVNIEESKKLVKIPYGEDDDESRKSDDESQSLYSPRLKSQPTKRRRNIDGSGPGSAKEVRALDDADDKRHVRKALGEKHFAETIPNRPVESADSTEGKGQQALFIKALNPDALAVKIKKEVMVYKEEDETLPGSTTGRDEKERSRKVVAGPLITDKKGRSTSSTENPLHCEVWGESAEVLNKDLKPTQKRRRLVGRAGRKHKARGADDSMGMINEILHASSVKSELLTSSHEASDSMQSPGAKDEPDRDGWNQGERLSGDSRYEKSEVGSYVDGNEDLSPMSRRNRREPKVSGKLIPLLESLRAICAHKCGHFFRHTHEPENDMYFRIVRVPIDLGTIRSRLEEGHYSGSFHFFRDLLLMVSNATVFYPKDSVESMAAFALRECVLKEMEHVFETEALVKQEGPSFRKRDSKHIPSQSRRKGGLKALSSMDRKSKERERLLKQPDPSNGVESRSFSHQSFTTQLGEGARGAEKRVDGKRSTNSGGDVCRISDSSDAKKILSSKVSSELARSLKGDKFPLEKANEVKERIDSTSGKLPEMEEAASNRPHVHATKDTTYKGGFSEIVASEKKAGFENVGSTGKGSMWAPHKAKEFGNPESKAAPAIGQEPVKRGVGRPPKHAQQGLLKARVVAADAPISTRKRSRR